MKAVVIEGPGSASVREIEPWAAGPGDVLVRCRAAAVCSLERQLFSGERRAYPVVGGHEVTGVVERIENPDSELQPGDLVVLDSVWRCRQCWCCTTGWDHLCLERQRDRRYGGFVRIGGGFAEWTTVPRRGAVKLPAAASLVEASLIEPLACCLHSIKKCRLARGETVVILGAGTIGALHLVLAQLEGGLVDRN